MSLDNILGRVRTALKALSEDEANKKGGAPVPTPPPDPDELPTDTRVEGADASPDEKDVEEAGEAQGKAQPPTPPEGEAPAGGDAPEGKPEEKPEEKPEDEGERPVAKSFDQFENRDLEEAELRRLLKSYGVTPPMAPEEIAHEGTDIESVLEAILQGLEKQSTVISGLRQEVKRLKTDHAETKRTLTKALDTLGDPRTAIPAEPRAFTKALDVTPAPEAGGQADEATALFLAMKSGASRQQAEASLKAGNR